MQALIFWAIPLKSRSSVSVIGSSNVSNCSEMSPSGATFFVDSLAMSPSSRSAVVVRVAIQFKSSCTSTAEDINSCKDFDERCHCAARQRRASTTGTFLYLLYSLVRRFVAFDEVHVSQDGDSGEAGVMVISSSLVHACSLWTKLMCLGKESRRVKDLSQ